MIQFIVDSTRRACAAWNRFWFTPADPTPLSLMRIIAGVLTLYVHIAYTFHLVDFFGPDGWYDQKTANENRISYPHLKAVIDWETSPPPFLMPPDPTQREAIRIFVERILAQPDFERTLQFMHSLALEGDQRNAMVRFIRDGLSPDATARDAVCRPYLDGLPIHAQPSSCSSRLPGGLSEPEFGVEARGRDQSYAPAWKVSYDPIEKEVGKAMRTVR
jgi:hypothetical protein